MDSYSPGLSDVVEIIMLDVAISMTNMISLQCFFFNCKDGFCLSVLIGEICFVAFQFNEF